MKDVEPRLSDWTCERVRAACTKEHTRYPEQKHEH